MNGRDLVRSMKAVGSVGAAQGLRTVRAAWRRRRTDASGLPPRGAERARVPGPVREARPGPGGGIVRFERSELRIMVAVNGAVFWGWDGAEPEPSYALAGTPEPDPRAVLEPDKDGGWRVVSERATVSVSRHGAIEVCTPGGVVLRRDLPPRWWEPVDGGPARWMQRSEVAADARFFGLGGRAGGPRLRAGTYRLWNTDPGGSFGPGDDPLYLTMPVQVVVADAGTHLVFHDTSWDGTVTLREGEEGAGSGHDRAGSCEVRAEGGPLRCWVVVGTPARVLLGWASLTGAPALPPSWALGYHHARWGFGSEQEVRRVVAGYREHGLPLDAVHLDIDHFDGHQVFTVDQERFPKLPKLAQELRRDGVRLVSIVDPAVRAEPGTEVYDAGTALDAFVRDASGRVVRSVVWPGESVFPDFTHARVRAWWGELYAERLAQGFSGFWHDMNEPTSFAAFGDTTLPRSARHDLEGRGGDHREAHNVYALCMARAGYEGLRALVPDERPFVFSRSGWAGLQRYGGTWSGDVTTGWPGLRASLALVLGLGLCGIPYSGPDVGGFDGSPSPELYLRWFQLGAYLPLFRTHAAIRAGRREPWEFGPEVLAHAREALLERRRLSPYFVTLAHLARRTGAPYVRPLWWGAPEDRALRDCEDAFLLGDCLLVAPVLGPGVDRRAVQLPRGLWYDTATERAYEGPGQVLVDAPAGRIPVLARAGAVIPVRGADGGLELEVWAPARGRTGGGLVVRDAGDGWDEPEIERYVTRWEGARVVVERESREDEDGVLEPSCPVRLRGPGGPPAQM
ncbi:glycosyl hydrolase [Streptomyces sp. LBUM 1476]|uniref:Glycoside hydrolase family 31 protein n=3 Tax=Streptomyces acidiscabies TaxID=42234 RepID=A0AAP6EEH3_9ACTN|nr:glycoside hydrolase family 31 protein [Streptomyces acidiscabies]MBP5940885.1 glycosyl hydrolase [Streptomyces sp. LBUM 1476]MBZ3912177.1 glycosyl hydrolase [Streptomyces acidiscabies]MDX2959987.1 glycoside hydrolase family 31 protein [Streptomyces acidiscabies]MDX3024194.1 glycoside hydrolase family 31 protein [Streptomyces acidiscabies]MDX3794617.1 glycoside hydrolase family 31 protein [Streptomyces acidiscabies]